MPFPHLIPAAHAAVYDGCGLACGFRAAASIVGGNKPLRQIILQALVAVLSFMALAAAIAIMVAGIYLIAGGGTDDAKGKAKKMILYAVIGIIVILLARLAVEFVIKSVS